MIEFVFMVLMTAALVLLVITPCFLGIVFDYSPSDYKDAVKASIYFWLFIFGVVAFALCVILVMEFLSGDMTPVTTLIETIKDKHND